MNELESRIETFLLDSLYFMRIGIGIGITLRPVSYGGQVIFLIIIAIAIHRRHLGYGGQVVAVIDSNLFSIPEATPIPIIIAIVVPLVFVPPPHWLREISGAGLVLFDMAKCEIQVSFTVRNISKGNSFQYALFAKIADSDFSSCREPSRFWRGQGGAYST
ncbi:MAG TPA: hypothetical protein PK821_04840 [Victivallales bacterium]|nr:hypothetical protein [Victivallales bacterium]